MKTIKYDISNEKVKILLSTDKCLKYLIKYIQCTELQLEPDGFRCIIKYIIGQQISDKARETIWNKFKSKFAPINPNYILKVKNNDIKAIGLSERKVETIKRIALEIVNGNIDFNNYSNIESEAFGPFEIKYPENKKQYPEAWKNILDKYNQYFNNETIVIAHSIGNGCLIKYLTENNMKIDL